MPHQETIHKLVEQIEQAPRAVGCPGENAPYRPKIQVVNWTEVRGAEVFNIRAEKHPTGWKFFDCRSGEVRWYPLAENVLLLATAEGLASGLGSGQSAPHKVA